MHLVGIVFFILLRLLLLIPFPVVIVERIWDCSPRELHVRKKVRHICTNCPSLSFSTDWQSAIRIHGKLGRIVRKNSTPLRTILGETPHPQ